jgi:tRNA dimethylallyltransferase
MASAKNRKTVLVICGPTASGKTSVAIELAKFFHTEIISADSRQCFKELDIGVARPSAEALKEVPHHFIATHSIRDDVSAATFEKYALQKAGEIFEKKEVIILAGGTGLYIKVFCEGFDEIPGIEPGIRTSILTNYNNGGIEWLREQVKKEDPLFYMKGEAKNPQRMMRALEVKMSTGQSILTFQSGKKKNRDFNVVKIGFELTKDELHRNISTRTENMMERGLVEEAKSLLPYKNLNALQTVGYSEIFDYLEGKISLEEAMNQIKLHTAQYAKRQVTWFRKDKEIKWFKPEDVEEIQQYCESRFQKRY